MAIGDPYVSRADFKAVLDITSTDEDDWIDVCIAAASKAIERRSGWPTFWKTSTVVTRTLDVTGRVVPVRSSGWSYNKILLRDGIASAAGFLVSGFSSPVLMPEDAISDGTPADAIRLPAGAGFGSDGTIRVTAVFGWPEVPADITWAAQMQANRLYRRKGSPEGIAGSAEWGLTRIPALDPDVLAILKGGGYMRAGIG
jgi:hypothetical protein